MSEVQSCHRRMVLRERRKFLDSLVVVGLEVSSVPWRASTSEYPRTISRALALGAPSSFLLHFSNILAVMVRLGSALDDLSNSHTWFSKKDWSSFCLAAWNTGLCFGMFFCSFCFWCVLLAKQLHTKKTTFRPKTGRRHALLGHQQRQLSSQRQKTYRVGSQLKINIPGKMHKNAMLDWGGSGRTKKHTTTIINHL